MKPSPSKSRAFTLIEMLAVIGIIALLVALLFPAIKSALIKAEQTSAQGGISNLSTAFKAYYTEYGKWPISDTAPTWNYVVDANMVALLSGTDVEPPVSSAQPTIESFGVIGGTHGQFQGNPRKITFLQLKQSDIGTAFNCQNCYLDPWKKAYYVKFDVTYTGVTPSPFEPTNYFIASGFLVWSDGPDNQENSAGASQVINKDNVTSW